jgi:hypothetical protein
MTIDPTLLPATPAALDPEFPTVTLAEYPTWMREPAKIVGWIVTTLGLVCSAVIFVHSPDVLDVLPKWARAASIVAASASLVLGRLQTWLTRNGLGGAGNGKDGVWSPAAVSSSQREVAVTVAAAKAVAPEVHAQ